MPARDECQNLINIDFGPCTLFMGYGLMDGTCQGISGCDSIVDSIDYSGFIYNTSEECPLECLNPAGCFQNGCADNQQCIDFGNSSIPGFCVASGCGLDGIDWICTADCNGGTCIPITPTVGDICQLNSNDTILIPGIIDCNGECIDYDASFDASNCFTCPQNASYQDCGTACPPTCETPTPQECTLQCMDGCFCDEGLLWHDNNNNEVLEEGECIPPIDCPLLCSEIIGDINNDGQTNILDIVSTVNCIMTDGPCPCGELVDINQDNNLDVLDIVQLVNIILNDDCEADIDNDGICEDHCDEIAYVIVDCWCENNENTLFWTEFHEESCEQWDECACACINDEDQDGICDEQDCVNENNIIETPNCPAVYDPVCGCDNITYSNSCNASAGGVTSWNLGECSDGTTCILDGTINDNDAWSGEVEHDWDGAGIGNNWCNTCTCDNGLLMCTEMACSCINEEIINGAANCTQECDPICGCDDITYCNPCIAEQQNGVTSWNLGACSEYMTCTLPNGTEVEHGWNGQDEQDPCTYYECDNGNLLISTIDCPFPECTNPIQLDDACCPTCDCIDEEAIDPNAICTEEYDPVCDCLGVTHANQCIAEQQNGVTHWTEGGCERSMNTCVLRDNITEVAHGWSGQDNDDNWCNSCFCNDGALACTKMGCPPKEEPTPPSRDCIDENQVDPLMACTREYAPVCGCDDQTYSNECRALSAGVTRWTQGECLNQSDNTRPEDPAEDCPSVCCYAMTASCLACSECQTIEQYCLDHPTTIGCEDEANDLYS